MENIFAQNNTSPACGQSIFLLNSALNQFWNDFCYWAKNKGFKFYLLKKKPLL
jgi:hypothetical protein